VAEQKPLGGGLPLLQAGPSDVSFNLEQRRAFRRELENRGFSVSHEVARRRSFT